MPMAARLLVLVLAATASWLWLRRAVGASFRGTPARLLLLDAIPFAAAAWLLSLTGRPLLSAAILLAVAAGISRGNAAKQAATGEMLVFTDWRLLAVVRYPSFYAEFITPAALLAGLAAAIAAAVALGALEPPAWAGAWPAAAGSSGVLLLCLGVPRGAHLLSWLGARNTLRCTEDPAIDSAAFGPFATPLIHAATARAERPGRRGRHAPNRSRALPHRLIGPGPLVLLQVESFFDARRLDTVVPSDLLPNFDRCVAQALHHGRAHVPAYGANTIRAELQALTGLPESVLGLDRFNPYAEWARAPVDSIAWRMRAAGYRTICLHPFDGGFYGRRHVLPNLGFDTFLDIGSFAHDAADGLYVPDIALVDRIAAVLRAAGPRTLIFAITMGNHSPWRRRSLVTGRPSGGAFAGFLSGLRASDAALGRMEQVMRRDWPDGVLAAFGDHRPAFNGLYAQLGCDDRSTDYVVMRPGHAGGAPRDIALHALPGLLLAAMAARPASLPLPVGAC